MSGLTPDRLPSPRPDMPVQIVDDRDLAIGIARRDRVLPEQQNFRVAHLFLFNSRNELLLQQLAATRERHPLAWGASVACYLFAGETYADAIRRRTVQELGCVIDEPTYLGKTSMNDGGSLKFIGAFGGRHDGPFAIDRAHIAQVEFVKVDRIASELASGGRVFTPTFRHLFGEFGAHLLS